jgi:hypothetical protein
MKERVFAKTHVDDVTDRLREYEEAIASKEFQPLERCDICNGAAYIDDEGRESNGCSGCLFFYEDSKGRMFSCIPERGGEPLSGSCCRSKKSLQKRFIRLLKRLKQNGWTFE